MSTLLATTRHAIALPPDVRIYVIVLQDSPRSEALAEELERHGLDGDSDAVEWVVRERDETDGIRGCYQSHQEVARRFVESEDLKAAVVLEDDVRFEARNGMSVAETIRDCVDAIRGGVHVCGVGGIVVRPMGPRVHSTLGCRYASFRLTHAYVMGRVAGIWIKNRRYIPGTHFDVELARVPGSTAIAYPAVAFQSSAYATTTGSSGLYRALTWARNTVSTRVCQLFMQCLMRVLGAAWYFGAEDRLPCT